MKRLQAALVVIVFMAGLLVLGAYLFPDGYETNTAVKNAYANGYNSTYRIYDTFHDYLESSPPNVLLYDDPADSEEESTIELPDEHSEDMSSQDREEEPKDDTTTNTQTEEKTEYSVAPSAWVYITDTGEKYHKYGCQYLQYSSTLILRSRAISLGYTPCSVCNP